MKTTMLLILVDLFENQLGMPLLVNIILNLIMHGMKRLFNILFCIFISYNMEKCVFHKINYNCFQWEVCVFAVYKVYILYHIDLYLELIFTLYICIYTRAKLLSSSYISFEICVMIYAGIILISKGRGVCIFGSS